MSFSCPFCNSAIDWRAERCPFCSGGIDPLFGPGERVADRFQILEVMGSGPLGATYRVRDLASEVDVALKTLANDLCPTDGDRAGFVSRVEMFAGRTIAGCAMPLEVGADHRVAYATSPLIEGVPLRAVLGARSAQRRPLEPEEALRVMLALAAATSALHSATPHGALRPENVMVTSRGLILTDCALGIAVAADKLQPRIQGFARAVPFVSPEAARGKRVTATTDLYALGAIATELLTGSPSMRALDSANLAPDVDRALRMLLEKDPSRRPGALGALLDSLSRACGFERRPADAPLPVPEVPLPPPASGRSTGFSASTPPNRSDSPPQRTPQSRRDGPTVTVPGRRVPGAGAEPSGSPSVPSPQPAMPRAMPSEAATRPAQNALGPRFPPMPSPGNRPINPGPVSPPGRVNPPTGALPMARPGSAGSGPPSGYPPSRSGPPPAMPPRRASGEMPQIPRGGLPSMPARESPSAPQGGQRSAIPSMPPAPSPTPGRIPSLPSMPPRGGAPDRRSAMPSQPPGPDRRQAPAPQYPQQSPQQPYPQQPPQQYGQQPSQQYGQQPPQQHYTQQQHYAQQQQQQQQQQYAQQQQQQRYEQPQQPQQPTGRDTEGIDPRLLRAARRLEAERRTDGEEVDAGEIELVDD